MPARVSMMLADQNLIGVREIFQTAVNEKMATLNE
jgi:hypothetical protein